MYVIPGLLLFVAMIPVRGSGHVLPGGQKAVLRLVVGAEDDTVKVTTAMKVPTADEVRQRVVVVHASRDPLTDKMINNAIGNAQRDIGLEKGRKKGTWSYEAWAKVLETLANPYHPRKAMALPGAPALLALPPPPPCAQLALPPPEDPPEGAAAEAGGPASSKSMSSTKLLKDALEDFEQEVKAKDQHILDLELMVAQKDARIRDLQNDCSQFEDEVLALRTELRALKRRRA